MGGITPTYLSFSWLMALFLGEALGGFVLVLFPGIVGARGVPWGRVGGKGKNERRFTRGARGVVVQGLCRKVIDAGVCVIANECGM